ncbi:hypothetical protein Ctob_000724, partial [Chrysochromulina tobinii]
TLCLGEVSVASESARGVLLLTPTLLAYVADGASADADTLAAGCWLLELADVLRVRVEATGGGAGRKPRGKPTPQLRLRTRVFEASLEVISPVAEAVELLEGVLPEGVLECDEFVAAPAAASVRAFEGDGADDPTDATDGADVETVHELASERCDGRAAFRAALSVQSRPVTLHGRAHSKHAPSLQQSTLTINAALQIENTLPYDVHVAIDSKAEWPVSAGCVPAGASSAMAVLPAGLGAALKVRLRIGGDAWGEPVAEYVPVAYFGARGSGGSWQATVASHCVLRDPHGRSAYVQLQRVPGGSASAVLALQLDAPLWILNQSQLPLLYSTSSASRLGRLRRRRRSNGDSNGDAEGVALGAGRRQAKATSSAASSAVGSFFRPKQGKAATESKSAKATTHVPASAAPTRAATRISMLRGRLPFGRKAKGGAEAVADAIDAGAVDAAGAAGAARSADVAGEGAQGAAKEKWKCDFCEYSGSFDDVAHHEVICSGARAHSGGVAAAVVGEGADGSCLLTEDEGDAHEDAQAAAQEARRGGEIEDDEDGDEDEDEDEELVADAAPSATDDLAEGDLAEGRPAALGPLLLSGRRIKLAMAGMKWGGGATKHRWSKPLSCEIVGEHTQRDVGVFEVGISVLAAPDVCPRSRIVLLHPRVRLVNRTGIDLMYRSKGGDLGGTLTPGLEEGKPGPSVPFHWRDTPADSRLLQLAIPSDTNQRSTSVTSGASPLIRRRSDGGGFEWCGAFSIDTPTELVVAIPGRNGVPWLVQVMVEAVQASLVVCFDLATAAPYRLCNDCHALTLTFRQKGSELVYTVAPRQTLDYTWDEPTGVRVLEVRVGVLLSEGELLVNDKDARLQRDMLIAQETAALGLVFETKLAELREPTPHAAAKGKTAALWTTVCLGKSTRLVSVSPSRPQELLHELQASLLVHLSSIGLSLVDHARRHELLHLRADGLSLSMMSSALEHEAQMTINCIQADAMLPQAATPVLLLGAPGSGQPWLQANITRRRVEKRLKRVSINAQQLGIALDEPLLAALVAFGLRCQPNASAVALTDAENTPTTTASSPAAAAAAAPSEATAPARLTPSLALVRAASSELTVAKKGGKRLWYIDSLLLHSISLQLTYRRLPGAAEHSASSGIPWHLIPNVSDLSMQFRAYELSQSFFERHRLLKGMRKHYMGEARRQLLRIVLKTDVAVLAADSLVSSKAGNVLLLTDGRLVCLLVRKAPPILLWQFSLRDVVAVEEDPEEHTALFVTTQDVSEKAPTLRVSDEAAARSLKRSLRAQVEVLTGAAPRLPAPRDA